MEASQAPTVFFPDGVHSHNYCGERDWRSFKHYGAGSQRTNPGFKVQWNTTIYSESPRVPSFSPRHGGLEIRRSPLAFDLDKSTSTFINVSKAELTFRRGLDSQQAFVPDDDAPPEEEWSAGTYRTLPSRDKFRLLEVLPGSDGTVQCKLHVCSLDRNAMSYEALSYTWGNDRASDKKEVQIIANGANQSLSISRNLHDALLALRRSNESRFIWADAICINQDDTKERSQQVRLMGEIFGGAWRVVIWVGEQKDRCYCGERLLEALPGSLTWPLSGICFIVNTWLTQQGRIDIKATYSTVSVTGAPSEQDHHNLGADSQGGATGNFWGSGCQIQLLRSSMLRFFERRWFSRIWVIQESVLARSAVVQLGPYQISWDWVGIAAAILVHSPFLTPDGSERESIPTEVTNAYLMYRLSASQTYFEPLKFSFAQLLQLTRLFDSKERRDKIYGLMGLPTTDSIAGLIVPDYNEETTTEKIYEDIAWLILESKSPLGFLSGAGTFGRFSSSGPSWIPSWHERRPWTILPINSHPQFECASRISMQIDGPRQRSGLALRGVIVDNIGFIQEDRRWSRYAFPSLYDTTRTSFLNKMSWGKEKWQKCAMTLTCGSDGMGYPVGDLVSHLADCAAAFLSETPRWPLEDLIALDKANQSERGDVVGLNELKVLARNGQADRYVSAAAPVRHSYRVFVTESSMFGTGPVDMKVGDLLCVLFGAEVPFLLRPLGDGYMVVGECYVYDLMHGEVLDQLASNPDGPLKATWLNLI
ncbi:hypothetical protein ACKLNR_014174 [Fusarium oxysporum f. sp. zingiberi]